MGKVDGIDQRAAHIGTDFTRQAAFPCLKRIHAFVLDHKAAGIEDFLDLVQLVHGLLQVLVPHRHGGGVLPVSHQIHAQFLGCGIGIIGLVLGIGVQQAAGFTRSGFLEHDPDVLHLACPVAALAQDGGHRLTLVEADEAVDPAVFDVQVIELVEDTGGSGVREARHRQGGHVVIAHHRHFPRHERLVRDIGIQVHRQVRGCYRMGLG